MAYDITLTGSVRANLLALQNTQSAIDTTNTRLNTGKQVNSVIDDAVAFFSAKALNDRALDFENRKASIDQSISAVNAALTATNSVDSLLKQLKGIVTAAKSASSVERGNLQTQFNNVKNQIDQLVADATYQGTNLVSNSITKLDTQFSERSASRLIVTAQRLSTYQTTLLASQTAISAVNQIYTSNAGVVFNASVAVASHVNIHAGATGLYYVTGVHDTAGLQTLNFLRYNTTDVSGANPAQLTGSYTMLSPMYINGAVSTTLASRFSETYVDSRDRVDSVHMFQTQYNAVSGLNVFLASQIFIVIDMRVTGSFGITTVSTGTLWSMAAFDPSTGLAGDQFNEVMNLVIDGVNAAIRQNNGAAKMLGTNVAVLNTRLEFTKAYVNVQKEGAGKLVLSDTNEEGANLVSLQTRQQLGIQALAFAGQSEQAVMRLFR